MKFVISAVAAAVLLSSCQKATDPAPATDTAEAQQAGKSAADILGPPPGLATVSVSAADAIADFRDDAPVTNPERPVNWDEILERDTLRRQMFYRAEQADPSVITATDRGAVAALETALVEQICVNLPMSATVSGYETVTPEVCAQAAT